MPSATVNGFAEPVSMLGAALPLISTRPVVASPHGRQDVEQIGLDGDDEKQHEVGEER